MFSDYFCKLRLLNRDVRLVVIVYGLFGFGWGGLYVLLFNLYLLRLGYDTEFIGFVNGASRLAFALVGLPAGVLGIRFGVRRVLIFGQSLIGVGLLTLPFGEYAPAALQPAWLIVTFVVAFIGGSLFFVNVTPYLMGITSPDQRSHVFSATAALFPLCAFAGSLVGGLLPGLFASLLGVSTDHPAPYRFPLMLGGGLFFLALPLLRATRHAEDGPQAGETGEDGGRPPFSLLFALSLVLFLVTVPQGAAMAFFNVYLDDELGVATEVIGGLVAIGQLIAVPAATIMPAIAARWGQFAAYAVARFVCCLWMIPMALVPHWLVAGVCFIALAAYGAVAAPLFTVYSQGMVPRRWRSAMSGSAMTSMGLSWTLTAALGGVVIKHLGYPTMFLGAALLGAAGVLLFVLVFRRGAW